MNHTTSAAFTLHHQEADQRARQNELRRRAAERAEILGEAAPPTTRRRSPFRLPRPIARLPLTH